MKSEYRIILCITLSLVLFVVLYPPSTEYTGRWQMIFGRASDSIDFAKTALETAAIFLGGAIVMVLVRPKK